MAYEMDKTDRKILYELDRDSRQPKSQIATAVHKSKQFVGHRMKRLEEENVLLKYFTIMDVSKLGYTVHKGFLKLQNLDTETEQSFITYLQEHPHTIWVVSCFGTFDLAFSLRAKDMEELDKKLTEIDRRYGTYIAERQIATIVHGEYFNRNYLLDEKQEQSGRESFFKASPTPIEMDATNWKILDSFGNNARANLVDIAKRTQKSSDTIRYRLNKLKRAGVIRSYNIVPNENNYPYVHYKTLFGLLNVTEKRRNALIEYCKQHPNIVYIVKSLGPWEFEIDLEIKDTKQLRSILMEIKTKFSDIIKDYSTLHLYQVHKYDFCPSIPD